MVNETNLYVMMGGMALFAIVVLILDSIGKRQRRNAERENDATRPTR